MTMSLAIPGRMLRPSVASPRAQKIALLTLAALAVIALSAYTLANPGGLYGLKGAGVTGTAPAGAGPFKSLVGLLNDNLLWLFVICTPIAISVGGTAMAVGYSRANEILFRVGAGVAVVLIGGPTLVA